MKSDIRSVMKAVISVALLSAAVPVFPALSYAIPISGTLNIVGDVRFDLSHIDWLPAGGGTGTFTVTAVQTGYFVPLANTTGIAKDLNLTPGNQPVGVPFLLTNFLTFAVDPILNFDLEFINPGVFSPADCFAAPAPGQVCTVPGSPFNLVNLGVGSTLSFTVEGTVSNFSDTSHFTGTYTTQFSGTPYQTLLATLFAGGSVQASDSGNFVVTPVSVPEPVSALLLGSGLLGLGIWKRKRPRAKHHN